MSLTSIIDIVWTGLAKKGIRVVGSDNNTELVTNQTICTGDICLCNWKPGQASSNHSDNSEQQNLN